jgi:thiol-disulfide isomerase/thioredoxin|tara:strand:- start:958 stop:1542 length:585 start_codon:yes stop_codon:yes gene_type:complete
VATGYPQIDIESTMVHSWRRLLIGFLFLYVIGAAVFLLAGRGGPTVSSNPINSPSGASSHEGVYRLEFTTFDGDVTSFSSFAGLPLIVNFFASWCTPCVKEMPDFEKLHTSHGEQFTILGLAVEGRRPARELVESTGVTYSVGLDENDLLIELGGFAMPTTVFISKDGQILESHSGVLDYDGLVSRLKHLFDHE